MSEWGTKTVRRKASIVRSNKLKVEMFKGSNVEESEKCGKARNEKK